MTDTAHMNMTELLPCPFCGGDNVRITENRVWCTPTAEPSMHRTQSVVIEHFCRSAGEHSSLIGFTRKTKEEAIEAWNARVTYGGGP